MREEPQSDYGVIGMILNETQPPQQYQLVICNIRQVGFGLVSVDGDWNDEPFEDIEWKGHTYPYYGVILEDVDGFVSMMGDIFGWNDDIERGLP